MIRSAINLLQGKTMKRTLLLILLTAFVASGCSTVQQRNTCIVAGTIAGALANGSGDDDKGEDAAVGALAGGAVAWLICRGGESDLDGDGVSDENDRCPGTPADVQVDTRGCAIDSDNDGVADYMDQCPDTPSGAAVDSNGCALDSDGDGIKDYADQCPNSARGAVVDSTGCEGDDDNDGVANSADQCPTTRAGAVVDADGCQVIFTLEGVHFEYDSADLTSAAEQHLADIVIELEEHGDVHVSIEGHTDSVGSDEYNQGLSERRAASVSSYLAGAGIAADRMSSKGFGESKPIASNDTDAGRADNRRVELLVSHH